MKNLATLMQKGNLTPKERVLLLVHNQVAQDTTGKAILTEADEHSLSEGWSPQNNYEAQEFNRYNHGWQMEGYMKLIAQAIFLSAQNSLLRAGRLVDYAMRPDCESSSMKFLERLDLGINGDEALELIIKNSGLDYDRTVYGCAFQNLSEDTRQDILALYPDARTESQYLDQEETVARLFNGKNKLTAEAREELIDAIIDAMHNPYAAALSEKGLSYREWWPDGYFAELPALEIAKKWADYNGLDYQADNDEVGRELIEKMSEHALANGTSIRELLRQTIARWLDEGLFVKEYAPIWNSNAKSTCNDKDTKLPHKQVFRAWLKAKDEAKTTLQKLIDSGQLAIENRDKDSLGIKETIKIITGESLYNLEGDFTFAEDYKKYAHHFKLLGYLIIFLRGRDFLKGYASLLAFADIYKKLSKIYEIDLGYKAKDYINSFGESIELLNCELRCIVDRLEDSACQEQGITFPVEMFIDDLLIHFEGMQPGTDEMETRLADEFSKILGDEF